MSETALINACLIFLRTHGCMAWRNNTGAARYGRPGQRVRFVRYGLVGSPDIVGYGPSPDGVGIAVECKRHPNQPTQAQQCFLDEARSHGAFAVCVWDLEELVTSWSEYQTSNVKA